MSDDGGAAFPQPMIVGAEGIVGADSYGHGGMSLRDYFAGQHLTVAVIHYDKELTAREAYAYADAMLAERGK